MSFLRHEQIYQSDVLSVSDRRRSCFRLRHRPHRLDEFAASYSLAGWSPPEPAPLHQPVPFSTSRLKL
jgi:hypothetical protein